ncbi:MAG: hypothetical protein ACKV2T_39390 [Kofleriaceae bacterium]
MRMILVLASIVGLGCGSTPSPPTTTGGDSGGSGSGALPTDPRCPDPAPTPTATCLQDCGPPVARDEDPPPPFRWATAEEVARREQYGCPRCLDATVGIATPHGERAVASLVAGDLVFTEDARGKRVVAPILRVVRVGVPASHRVVMVRLEDGRSVRVSAQHPLAEDGVVGDIVVGASLDGSTVIERHLVVPTSAATWDILPAGETGLYWANGVRLGSTLR